MTTMSKTPRFDIETLSFNPNDMGADHHSTDAERRALANRCLHVSELVLDAHGMGDVDCDADRNEGDDADRFGNEVFDAVCGETSAMHAAGIVLRTYGGPTAAWVVSVGKHLDRDAREAAHAEFAVRNPTDTDARKWAAIYMTEYARVLGRREREGGAKWPPCRMSDGALSALQEHANLLGVAATSAETFKAYCGK
jgi:hypothetical protein